MLRPCEFQYRKSVFTRIPALWQRKGCCFGIVFLVCQFAGGLQGDKPRHSQPSRLDTQSIGNKTWSHIYPTYVHKLRILQRNHTQSRINNVRPSHTAPIDWRRESQLLNVSAAPRRVPTGFKSTTGNDGDVLPARGYLAQLALRCKRRPYGRADARPRSSQRTSILESIARKTNKPLFILVNSWVVILHAIIGKTLKFYNIKQIVILIHHKKINHISKLFQEIKKKR